VERLLTRLERTFLGRIAIERLTTFLVGGMGITWVLCQMRPEFAVHLYLIPQLVPVQPWRLVSFLFFPPASGVFWVFFSLYFLWMTGSYLEAEWGAFKLNVFYFLGAIGTVIAAFATGMPMSNTMLNMSLLFAFATLFPDFVIQLFFIIPIRIKWLALVAAGYLVLQAVEGDLGVRVGIGAALGNYFLFFSGHLVALARGRRVLVRQAARRAAQRTADTREDTDERACALCGKKQSDGADIRVCSCERCGAPRQLCLEHARDH